MHTRIKAKRVRRLGLGGVLIVGISITGLLLTGAISATAFVPQAPTFVDCSFITIDPPPGVTITFYGTIGGVNIGLPATPIPNTVFSHADITAYTGGTGPIPYTVIPYWDVAPNPYGVTSGFGPVATGTLVCHPDTTTTTQPGGSTSTTLGSTTSTSTSTSIPNTSSTSIPSSTSTSTTIPGSSSTTTVPGPTFPLKSQITNRPPGSSLPYTGGVTLPVLAVSVTLLLAGAGAVVGARRRTCSE